MELTEMNYFDKDLFLKGLLVIYVTTEAEAESLIQALPSLVNYSITFTEYSKIYIPLSLRENFEKLVYVRVQVGEPYFYYGSTLKDAAEFNGCKYSLSWSLLNNNSPVSLEDFLKDFL